MLLKHIFWHQLSTTSTKDTWLESILCELHIYLSLPPLPLCDNVSATYLATNPIIHARTKHVEIDYHFIQDRVVQNSLIIQYTPFEDQLVNVMSKAFPIARFSNLRFKLTVLP